MSCCFGSKWKQREGIERYRDVEKREDRHQEASCSMSRAWYGKFLEVPSSNENGETTSMVSLECYRSRCP